MFHWRCSPGFCLTCFVFWSLKAVAAAKSAFGTWKNEPFEVRQAALLKFADLLEARAQEFAKALTSEQGKPLVSLY